MLSPGDRFDRYTILERIGQGGMGTVYRAEDPKLGRRVALKVIGDGQARSREAAARLVREARAAAALDHPNAVAVFDVGEHEGTAFIVMELVDGQSLRTSVGDAEVPLAAKLARLGDVAKALAAAHRRGLVHRDVKPENVMVRGDGMVKVLDFGIARRAGGAVDPVAPTVTPALPTLTMEGVQLGTPVYMAPEQIRGDPLDGRADQFSWGVLAYELLAGKLPWRGADALAAMASVLTDGVDPAPLEAAGVPLPVRRVILRALSKRPEDRFASMDEAAAALERAARDESEPEPAASETAQQSFSTAEVREVLGKAVERQAARSGAKLRFEDLLEVAAEVGVDEESLREASRALRAKDAPAPAAPAAQGEQRELAAEAAAWLRRVKRDFRRHLGVYAIVNGAILILGLGILTMTPWWIWVLPPLGWGIGLAIHALVALTATEDDWREEHEQKQWWLGERQKRHEERMAKLRGKRVPTPPPAEKLRVQVDPRTTGARAEAEAAAEEQARRRHRR